MSTSTVVIAAGGTGGHIYPGMAVARVLEKRQIPVVWIGTKEGLESKIVPDANIDIRFIKVSGLRGKGLVGKLLGPFKVLGASFQSARILSDVKADAVLGMGGFVSGPVGLAALFTRRMLVLHEQNAVAGMTNKWLARFAARVYSAMPNVFPEKIGAEIVGNPVRKTIEALGLRRQGKTLSSLNVLVVGGSRGARILNETVPAAIGSLVTTSPDANINVWHQTGPADEQQVQASYEREFASSDQASALPVRVDAYISDITEAYEWADVMVCRAGAMTVSELSAAALPGVLVPFPHHVDDHQTRNARFLSDAGAAVLLPQTELDASSLANTLQRFVQEPELLANMSQAALALHKGDAASVIADALAEAGG